MADIPSPTNREEQYLNAIAGGSSGDLPTPITREEQYLNAIAKDGGGGSGGHTIENASGTDLTQRDTMKFGGGLNASDDSTNKKTVITDEYEEIPYSTWSGYTPEQQAEHPNAIITGAPDGGYELPTASASTLGGVKVGEDHEIDENGKLRNKYVLLSTVTADGVKTRGGIITELFENVTINPDKLYYIDRGGYIFLCVYHDSSVLYFSRSYQSDTAAYIDSINYSSNHSPSENLCNISTNGVTVMSRTDNVDNSLVWKLYEM